MLQVLKYTHPAEQFPKLLDQPRALIRMKNYGIRSEGADGQWIKGFILLMVASWR